MKVFKLPDLGEGLPDAEIREWYVNIGDTVKTDQPLVAMETAKALVDVPSPHDGTIEKLFGQAGDTIETDQPLIGFEGKAETETAPKDTGTVVGAIEAGEKIIEEAAVGITTKVKSLGKKIKATPAVRMLAKQLGVELNDVTPSGDNITAEDVKKAAQSPAKDTELEGNLIPLSNVRRAMVLSMNQSHQSVVPVTVVDDADIHAWKKGEDMTLRQIRAVQAACEAMPNLNASFDGKKMAYQSHDAINLGVAVDTPEGLYVPVLKDIAHQTDDSLRETLNRFKTQARTHSIPQADLHGTTLILSNFGSLAGRYANPVVIPPMVAIIGVGRARDEVVAVDGKPAVHRMLPLAVTVDHRAITGGEAVRFLKAMMDSLML